MGASPTRVFSAGVSWPLPAKDLTVYDLGSRSIRDYFLSPLRRCENVTSLATNWRWLAIFGC